MKNDKGHFVSYNAHHCNCGWEGDNIQVHFKDVEEARKEKCDMTYYVLDTINRVWRIDAGTAQAALNKVQRIQNYKPIVPVLVWPAISSFENYVVAKSVKASYVVEE